MHEFYQYETDDMQLRIEDAEGQPAAGVLDGLTGAVVTIAQGCVRAEWGIDELGLDSENSIINLHMAQEQSGMFMPGPAMVQVNLLYEDSERDTTTQAEVMVLQNLHRQVMQ